MPTRTLLLRPAVSLVAGFVAAMAASAQAADLTINDAKIAGGKLVISGTGAPNSWLRLDGQDGADFSVRSGADGTFAFGLLYHPGDCIIDVQRLLSPAKLGPATEALVSGCAPRALTARGAWEAGTDYLAEDVVSAKGTSWRAKRGSIGSPPAAGSLDWEQFAAKTNPLGSGSGPDDVGIADAPTGPAGGDLTGTYPNPQIADLAITSNKIANDAVTTSKIPLLAITSNRLANDAITTSKFQNQSVTNAKLALDAVSSERILDASITAADLGANSVGQSEIQTNGVAATEIADNSIDSGEIVNNSLSSSDLAADSVRGSELGTINRRSQTSGVIAGNGTGNVGVQCLGGERVLAGGNDASSATNIVIVASRNDGANGWRVFARNLAAGNQTVTVHAYCLEAS